MDSVLFACLFVFVGLFFMFAGLSLPLLFFSFVSLSFKAERGFLGHKKRP
jgi:hypothetical protein